MIHEILKILDTTDLPELDKQRITTDLLRLFNVVAMLPSDDEIEKAAEVNASRFYATDTCQDTEWYATHHGFMDGADFVKNKVSGN
jgi:hypothetical protein